MPEAWRSKGVATAPLGGRRLPAGAAAAGGGAGAAHPGHRPHDGGAMGGQAWQPRGGSRGVRPRSTEVGAAGALDGECHDRI